MGEIADMLIDEMCDDYWPGRNYGYEYVAIERPTWWKEPVDSTDQVMRRLANARPNKTNTTINRTEEAATEGSN
jgi:hypothetical protein